MQVTVHVPASQATRMQKLKRSVVFLYTYSPYPLSTTTSTYICYEHGLFSTRWNKALFGL